MKGIFSHENILIAVIAVVLIGAFLLLLLVATQPTMTKVEWTEETYIVKSGDSLWAIADRYCPDIVDKREWIAEVKELNNLYDSTVHPGQMLKVLAAAG